MKLINFRLFIGDYAASVHFWRDIMQFPLKFGEESMSYAYFDLGNVGIELYGRESFAAAMGEATPPQAHTGHPASVVFEVEDVDATYAELVARGASVVTAPQDYPAFNVRLAEFRDPDGYLVDIYKHLVEDPEG